MIESETLELKTSLAETNEILNTISAFSNTRGGEILVGIVEKDLVEKIGVGRAIKYKGRT